VFASEHLVAAWQLWSCAAAPILTPDAPSPIGLVDITALWDKHSRQAINVAKALAQAVADRLGVVKSLQEETVRQALRAARETGDSLLAVNASGRVIGRNDVAVRRRIFAEAILPAPAREALVSTLFSPSSANPEDEALVTMPEGSALHAYAVRHQGSTVGAILRVAASEATARAARTRIHPPVRYRFECILGRSEAIRHAVALARATASNDLPVVVTGESGTGKELFAQSIHAASGRRSGPFVAVNCGSIPPQLVEAELFGYEAGSFTGAKRGGSAGRFEDADGGTLFLDEVSELTAQAQTALLRLLQEQEVVRIGASAPRHVDVRIVAATNKRLEDEVLAERFRRDLYYRLNVLPITLPPLRERGCDITLLAQAFLAEAAKDLGRADLTFNADALQALSSHRWPGNIRELRNVVLRVAATAPHPEITAGDLAFDPEPVGAANRPLWDALRTSLRSDAETANRFYAALVGPQAKKHEANPEPPRKDELNALSARRWLESMLREINPPSLKEGDFPRSITPAPERLNAGYDSHLHAKVTGPESEQVHPDGATLREALTKSEREMLLEALDACGWNFGQAARRLGIARSTLYRLLHKNQISRLQRPTKPGHTR